MQAHRGDSEYYPENTIPAFAAAIEQGYDIIELDPKFTKDGHCVILHDQTVNRTGRYDDGSEIPEKTDISKLTLAEVKALDFGVFKGEQFKGTRISTLAEVLAFLKGKSIQVKLDNVFQKLFDQEQFEIFCSVIEEADMEEQICFTCKTIPYFNYLANRFPLAEMHYDGSLTPEALAECKKLYAYRKVTIWIPYDNKSTAWFKGRKADAEFCRTLHEYGDVGIWLISEVEELRISKEEYLADVIETNGKLKPSALDTF